MLRQCATTAITAVHAASTMFAMAAMLGRLAAQLKMPRLDAYEQSPAKIDAGRERPHRILTGPHPADGQDCPLPPSKQTPG
jgi:hypothetical protein